MKTSTVDLPIENQLLWQIDREMLNLYIENEVVFMFNLYIGRASIVAQLVKNLICLPWVGKILWRRERLPTLVFWLGEFHGLCIVNGRKESDTTERLSLSLFYIRTFKYVLLKR